MDKPKPQEVGKTEDSQTIWRCRICGYEYVGEELSDEFICPLCKHPASDFEKVVKKTEVKEMAANKYAGTQTDPKSIISYRILAAKRSERESTCRHSTLGPGTCAPSTQEKIH